MRFSRSLEDGECRLVGWLVLVELIALLCMERQTLAFEAADRRPEDAAEDPAIERLSRDLAKKWERIESLAVGYHVDHQFSQNPTLDLDVWAWSDNEFELRGNLRMKHIIQPDQAGRGGSGSTRWSQQTVLWDGERSASYRPGAGVIITPNEVHLRLHWELFLWCIGSALITDEERWPHLNVVSSYLTRPDMSLDRWLRGPGHRTLLLSGSLYTVTAANGEVAIIDGERVVLIERRLPNPRRGYVTRIRNLQFQECLPGLWLPIKSKIDRYSVTGTQGGSLTIDVRHLNVNTLEKSDFALEVPMGTYITDAGTGQTWRHVEPGTDPLDEAINRASLKNGRHSALLVMNVVVFTLAGLLFVIRMHARFARRRTDN